MYRGPSPEETSGYAAYPLPPDAPAPQNYVSLDLHETNETPPPPGPIPPEAVCLASIQQACNQLPDTSSALKPSHAWKKIQEALEQPRERQEEAVRLMRDGMHIAETISSRLSSVDRPEDLYSGRYLYQLDRALAFRPMLEHIAAHPNSAPDPEISKTTARNVVQLTQRLEDLRVANLEGIIESRLEGEENVLLVAYLALRSRGTTVQPVAPPKRSGQSPRQIHLYIDGVPLRIVSVAEGNRRVRRDAALEIDVDELWKDTTAGISGNLDKLQRDAHRAISKETKDAPLSGKKARLLDQGTEYILEQVEQHRAIHV